MWAWGDNSFEQLGAGSSATRTTPNQVGIDTNWAVVAAGTAYTVGVKTDGTLWAWGFNQSGQLGDGTTTNRTSPVQVGATTNWVAVAAGDAHTMALAAP